MAIKSLTEKQKRAYDALTLEWQSARQIKSACDVSIATLNAIVSKGCAIRRVKPGAGFSMMRDDNTFYRRLA